MVMGTVNKVVLSTLLFGLVTCKPSKGPIQEPTPLNVATFLPPPIYQVWAQRAITCAVYLEQRADSLGAPFHVVHDSVDVHRFLWIAVFTEENDGSFPCNGGRCIGRFMAPDTIEISGQRLNEPDVVAHEVMHWAIQSDGEKNWKHGPPWGLCEYITPPS